MAGSQAVDGRLQEQSESVLAHRPKKDDKQSKKGKPLKVRKTRNRFY